MKKPWICFIAGVVMGVVVTVVTVFVFKVGIPEYDDILWFEHEGTCITRVDLKVLRALRQDRALVGEAQDEFLESPIMLLVADDIPNFYDEQIIKMPQGACAKHVGNFNYKTKDDGFKTVPVVSIQR